MSRWLFPAQEGVGSLIGRSNKVNGVMIVLTKGPTTDIRLYIQKIGVASEVKEKLIKERGILATAVMSSRDQKEIEESVGKWE
jgi:hypothetical protein